MVEKRNLKSNINKLSTNELLNYIKDKNDFGVKVSDIQKNLI